MEKFMYFCRDCNKLYKVAGFGRRVKCNSCGKELIDLKVTDEDYALMDASEKNSLKQNASIEEDTVEPSVDVTSSESIPEKDKSKDNFLFLDDEQENNVNKKSFFDAVPDDFEKKYQYTDSTGISPAAPEVRSPITESSPVLDDTDINLKSSITLSWILCFLPLVLWIILEVLIFMGVKWPSPVTWISYIAVITADNHFLKQSGITLGLGWEFLGLIFPPAYLFKKSKVLGQRYTCAILSLVLFVFLLVASTLMWMLEDKLTSFVDNEEVVIDPMVTGSRYYDSNSKTVLDLTDDRNFVLYLDHNEPSEIKVEGKYRVYKGEAAIDKIVSIKEIDTTREKLEEMIDQLTSVTYYDKPGTEPYKAKRENFYTFIFDIESNKNRDGSTNESNVKQGLYIGFYIDELDAFEMVNLVTQNNYRWVRQ